MRARDKGHSLHPGLVPSCLVLYLLSRSTVSTLAPDVCLWFLGLLLRGEALLGPLLPWEPRGGGLLGGGPPCCVVVALWSSSIGIFFLNYTTIYAISLTMWDMDIAAPLPKGSGGLAQ